LILFAALGLGGVLATVLGFLGGLIWWFDLLASFRAQLAAGSAIVGLVLVAGGWRRIATVTLTGSLVNIGLIVPLYLTIAPEGPPDLRVLSFNILADNKEYDQVVEYIASVEADVVFLHEVSRPWEEALQEADLPYEMTINRASDLIFATLVLAPEGAQVVSNGWAIDQPRSVVVAFDVEGTPVRLMGIHPLAPSDEDRARLRNEALELAGEWATEQNGPAAIVGDFNATPWSYPFRRLTSQGLIDSEQGFGLQPSFPADTFWARVPIDHLLHNAGFDTIGRTLDSAIGSDHLPLVVDLIVVEEAA